MIAQQLSRSQFIDALLKDENSDFSYESANMLYDHYWDLAEATGETFYLDRVAIRCEWTEYTEDELREQYNVDYDEDVEVALVDRGLVSYAIKVPMHGKPHHYLVMD